MPVSELAKLSKTVYTKLHIMQCICVRLPIIFDMCLCVCVYDLSMCVYDICMCVCMHIYRIVCILVHTCTHLYLLVPMCSCFIVRYFHIINTNHPYNLAYTHIYVADVAMYGARVYACACMYYDSVQLCGYLTPSSPSLPPPPPPHSTNSADT